MSACKLSIPNVNPVLDACSLCGPIFPYFRERRASLVLRIIYRTDQGHPLYLSMNTYTIYSTNCVR